ncbi:MAG: MEDS domain-containing protein [Candidatus Lokiarchaeia archaeon]
MVQRINEVEIDTLRKSGIKVLGDITWGTHLCQFYETKEDLTDILVPYFVEGLRNNEFCMWITSPPLDADEARLALQKEIPDLEQYIKNGQIEILPYTDWYLLGGEFDTDRVLSGWVAKEKWALDQGFDGLRLTGNTFWLERNHWKSFVDYEAKVNDVIEKYRMIAICTYSLEKCTGLDVVDVVRNHQSTLVIKGKSWYLVEDVSKRKFAENKAAESQTKLMRSEEKYRQLIKNLNEGVWVLDDEARTTFVNDRMAEMLGYTIDEMLGRHLFSFMDKKDVEFAKYNLERRIKGIKEEHEFEFVCKDGTRIYAHLGTSPIIDEEGNYTGALAAVMDISERKRMEEELRRYSEQLEELVEERTKKLREAERLATIGETAAMVGHDLRNPLQVIIGSIYLAEEKLKSLTYPEDRQQKYELEELLQTIEGQIDYMNKIVSDLEDYAKPLEPQLVETSLHQLITDTLSTITIPKAIKISIEIEEDFPLLMIDPVFMRRVFSNLVMNALQAMLDGGQLTIRASKTEDATFIRIEDTGEGISEENLPKIFEPLFTTRAKGQGLGLSVCKRLIEAHGGRIRVDSKVGKGSTFTVEIPLRKK